MSYHSRSPTSSSSTLIVPFDHHHPDDGALPTKKPVLKLITAPYPSLSFPEPKVDKRMSGKGFIEPHRNNLPRRKKRVLTTTPEDIAPEFKDETFSHTLFPTSQAGPCDGASIHDATSGSTTTPIHLQTQTDVSSSVDTNITEPPSSRRASPTPSAALPKSPVFFNSPTSYPPFQSPKPAPVYVHPLHIASPQSPLITPRKGHLEPTSATLPRRHRSAAQEQERRRRSMIEQKPIQEIKQMRTGADSNLMANWQGQSIRRRHSVCAQELSKGIVLGFLTEKGDENIVRINVYDPTIPLSSSPSPSPSPSTLPTSTSEPHLQLSLPTDPSSYTDGTTSLTDSQIQQACTFIDEHISIPLVEPSSTSRPGRMSVLILAPSIRPEEAMSIGISYLAGIEDMNKGVEGDKASNDHDDDKFDDYTYSTVHRLLMALHDDPGSPILEAKDLTISEQQEPISKVPTTTPAAACGMIDTGSLVRGFLRPEWRGVLSFDGMQRLDKVWTCKPSGQI